MEEIRKIIDERKELGYVSVKGFVEDAVRRRLEVLKGMVKTNHDTDRQEPVRAAKH